MEPNGENTMIDFLDSDKDGRFSNRDLWRFQIASRVLDFCLNTTHNTSPDDEFRHPFQLVFEESTEPIYRDTGCAMICSILDNIWNIMSTDDPAARGEMIARGLETATNYVQHDR